jgi:hypothetical protein
MIEVISRREALKTLLLASGALMVGQSARTARADELPHVTSADPVAAALGYHDDAKTVDPQQFHTYQPGQTCITCLQLQGVAGQPWRPCAVLPGKLVNANGWCQAYAKKA